MAVGNRNDLLVLIDTKQQKIVRTAQFPFEVNEIQWSADGNMFFLATGNGTVEVTTQADMTDSIRRLVGHTANVYCLARTPTTMASGSADAAVLLWSLPELVCERAITAVQAPLRSLSFSVRATRAARSAALSLVYSVVRQVSGVRQRGCLCAHRRPGERRKRRRSQQRRVVGVVFAH